MQNRKKKKLISYSRIRKQGLEFIVSPGGTMELPDGTEKKYPRGLRFKSSIVKHYLTPEVARILKVSKKKIYGLLSLGVCSPEIMFTKQLRFSDSDIEKMRAHLAISEAEKSDFWIWT
jgi:hypothetical protein